MGADGSGPDAGVSFSFDHRRNDGYAELRIAEDGMSAVADFHPPIADGLPLAPDYVESLLTRAGVVEGVDHDLISESCLAANLDRKTGLGVMVAKGRAPVPGVVEHLALGPGALAALGRPDAVPPDGAATAPRSGGDAPPEDGRPGNSATDWREVSPFFVVGKGEAFGRVEPAVEGRDGADIFGKPLPAGRTAVTSWIPGAGTELADGVLRAAMAGMVAASGQTVSVDPTLRLKNGVGYHTGHIAFPGDIDVSGTVRDGFRVKAGGDAGFRDTLDASDVTVAGNLTCHQGIIGRGGGFVRVGGTVAARFIESCSVAARGDVRVALAVVSSRVWSLGTVDAGDRGRIVGGEVWGAKGLRCGSLGNQAGIRTLVHAGTDFAAAQRIEETTRLLHALAPRIDRLEELARERPNPKVAAALGQALAERVSLTASLTTLAERLHPEPGAVVEVKAEAHPGTIVEICGIRLEVTERLHACRFRLEGDKGRILVER